MTQFIQLHALVAYPASNLNRDDSGRPKTMIYGGAERLRISSQSLKRAYRVSDVFSDGLSDAIGTRAQSFGRLLEDILTEARYNLTKEAAIEKTQAVITHDKLGKVKSDKKKCPTSDTEQLAHLGPDEISRLRALAKSVADGVALDKKAMNILVERPRAVDIALFGRMFADNPGYNVEAAAQVAHAFTVNRAFVEDDFFTAVDELKKERKHEDPGAGFIGVQEFGTGLFYLYTCISADQLVHNLAGDKALAQKAVEAFIRAIITVSPTGKQSSYGSHAYASFALAEVGTAPPRTLSSAFLKPVTNDFLTKSIAALLDLRGKFARAYGLPNDNYRTIDINADEGTLTELIEHAQAAVAAVPA